MKKKLKPKKATIPGIGNGKIISGKLKIPMDFDDAMATALKVKPKRRKVK